MFSRFETKGPFTVIGSQVSAPCDEIKTAIPAMLKTHLPRIPQIKNTTKSDTAYGVVYPEKEGKVAFIFAHEVSKVEDVPEGMISTEIPEAEYAVIVHKGLILNIKDAYKYFEETWLKENDYERVADKPLLEVYGSEFKGGMFEDSVAEIYFPVQKKN